LTRVRKISVIQKVTPLARVRQGGPYGKVF
jgi:hypothetical protein